MKKWLERKKENELKKKRQGNTRDRGTTEEREVMLGFWGKERGKAKENIQKKKGREQAEMTLAYSTLNTLIVIKNNRLHTE